MSNSGSLCINPGITVPDISGGLLLTVVLCSFLNYLTRSVSKTTEVAPPLKVSVFPLPCLSVPRTENEHHGRELSGPFLLTALQEAPALPRLRKPHIRLSSFETPPVRVVKVCVGTVAVAHVLLCQRPLWALRYS